MQKLPFLHKNSRSSRPHLLPEGEGISVGPDPYYAYGQGQHGAAWHAVAMNRAAL